MFVCKGGGRLGLRKGRDYYSGIRDVPQKAVGHLALWYLELVCLVPVPIWVLYSPAVI
jgi:hypothetical protein